MQSRVRRLGIGLGAEVGLERVLSQVTQVFMDWYFGTSLKSTEM